MGPNSKRRSRADQRRIDGLHRIGCIVTALYFLDRNGENYFGTPGDIHHLLDPATGCRYADEHRYTICLKPWYHRGVTPMNAEGRQLSEAEATRLFGPSMALDKPEFIGRFGTELELLEATDALLEAIER